MKKLKSYIVVILIFSGLISCESIEQNPYASLSSSVAFNSVEDAGYWRNGFYSGLRGASYGTRDITTIIQSDLLNATLNYGNSYGSVHTWDIRSDDRYVSAFWQNRYSALKNLNECIAKFPGIPQESEKDKKAISQYLGEAHIIRAYYFFLLTQRFSKNYDASNADTELGIPLVLEYDVNALPSRSSLKESYEQILSDIGKAEEYLKGENGVKGKSTFSIDAVKALKARVLLNMKNWNEAYTISTGLIKTGVYPLVNTEAALKEMWYNDGKDESILQLYVSSPDELPNRGLGSTLLGYNPSESKYSPSYMPSSWVVDLYDDNDQRKKVYFAEVDLLLEQNYKGFVVNKYPGNPLLYSGATNYAQAPKVFRIAEQYLIAAEAAYNMGQMEEAKKWLNELRVARGVNAVASSGTTLLKDIKEERLRELAFEGFRLDDLKRWDEPAKRRDPQSLSYVVKTSKELYYELNIPAGDYRFVWPIPSWSVTLNTNLKQNQGY